MRSRNIQQLDVFLVSHKVSIRNIVGNVPYDVKDKELLSTLQLVGPLNNFRYISRRYTKYGIYIHIYIYIVYRVYIYYNRYRYDANDKPAGFGFSEYKQAEIAESALRNLRNIEFNGRTLRVGTAVNDTTIAQMQDVHNDQYQNFLGMEENSNSLNLEELLQSTHILQKKIIIGELKELVDSDPRMARYVEDILAADPTLTKMLLKLFRDAATPMH